MRRSIAGAAAAILLAAIVSFEAGGGTMNITSSAFHEGGNIPSKFTCDGSDTSPHLQITGVPSGTKSLVLIADDRTRQAGCLLTGWSGIFHRRPIQLRKAVRQKACKVQMISA